MSFIGPHHAYHHHKKPHHHTIKNTGLADLIDKSIYIIGFIGVAANFPQLFNIWISKQTAGVSLVSWSFFLIGSFFWFGYGVIHKEKPIIVLNGLLISVQAGIVLGLLINA